MTTDSEGHVQVYEPTSCGSTVAMGIWKALSLALHSFNVITKNLRYHKRII